MPKFSTTIVDDRQVDLEEAVNEKQTAVIALRAWRNGEDCFHTKLFNLIQRAEPENRMKLRKGFPIEVETWNEWYCSANEEEFFAKHKIAMPEGR